jgi:glyoxylase-like metal-dependent hydrolase (beta-lactamase superfamily II)
VIVDPAYAVGELLDTLAADGMRCTGALVTHYHADHIGGSLGGWSIEGASALLERVSVPLHVQRDEVPWVQRSAGLSADDLVPHGSGDVVSVGGIDITLVHTPGHTPGSQCFLVAGRLVSGDTLFLEGCGRTDLPGSDSVAMYESLTTRLAAVPDDTVLYPGHRYSPEPSAPMSTVRRENFVFVPRSVDQWLAMFGR